MGRFPGAGRGILSINLFTKQINSDKITKTYISPREAVLHMCEEKIKAVTKQFARTMKDIYGDLLRDVILYGSCARGDFTEESDIDVMVLLDIPQEEIGEARRIILEISNRLDLENDVVLAPVIQNYLIYQKYIPVSSFYQNVKKEGVRIA